MVSPNPLRIISNSLQVLGAALRLLLTASWVFAGYLLLCLLVLRLPLPILLITYWICAYSMQLFLITYRFRSTAYCLCLLLAGFIRKTYLCSAHWSWMCVCFYRWMSFALFYFLLPFAHFVLLITYWLLATTYSSAAALTLQGLLALCSTALFLPYWQALLTHSARLHGILLTAYYLLTNYYLFAYSYNTLNNHANYHVSYWQSPSHRPVFSPKPLHILLLFLHPFHFSLLSANSQI